MFSFQEQKVQEAVFSWETEFLETQPLEAEI